MTEITTKNSSLEEEFDIISFPDELEHEAARDYFRNNFENLVFEGGGIRGIAFGGALYYLEKHDMMGNIKRFAGSSAGAIVSAGLAVGYTGSEIIRILHTTDFESFQDDSFGVIPDIHRLFTKFGVFKGEAFYKWMEDLIFKKLQVKNITFKQLYDLTGKELVITGSCLNTGDTCYYHHSTHPDYSVSRAVRISMSIPIFFASIKDGDNIMVDGGLLNNYPIWVFDGNSLGDANVTDEEISKSKTLGFKLMTDQEQSDSKLYHYNDKITNVIDYVKALMNSVLIQVERGHIRSGYWTRTVRIPTYKVSSLDFVVTLGTKKSLITSGYSAMHNKLSTFTALLQKFIKSGSAQGG